MCKDTVLCFTFIPKESKSDKNLTDQITSPSFENFCHFNIIIVILKKKVRFFHKNNPYKKVINLTTGAGLLLPLLPLTPVFTT